MISKIIASVITRLVSPLTNGVLEIVKAYQQNKMSEKELEAKIRELVSSSVEDIVSTEIKSGAKLIEAEMHGEGWIQRNWRPLVAVSFSFVLLFYAVIMPVLVAWGGLPPVKVGDLLLEWVMKIVLVSITGYVGGRSLEKIVRTIVSRK